MGKNKQWFLLPLRTILFILIFFLISLITKIDIQEISKYWTLVVIVCNFITIFVLYKFCKKNNINIDKIDYSDKIVCNIQFEELQKEEILFDFEKKNINLINLQFLSKKLIEKSIIK